MNPKGSVIEIESSKKVAGTVEEEIVALVADKQIIFVS